jgi:hypothetical protein
MQTDAELLQAWEKATESAMLSAVKLVSSVTDQADLHKVQKEIFEAQVKNVLSFHGSMR